MREKASDAVWPKLSCSCMPLSSFPSKPSCSFSKPLSGDFGIASTQSRPSRVPASASVKFFSSASPPTSSAAGVLPIAASTFLTVTCSRSGS